MANRPGALAGGEARHLVPRLGGQHRPVVGLDVADDRQGAGAADVVQGPVDHRQPAPLREPLGDVGFGIAHSSSQAVAGGFQLGAGDRVRLPGPSPGLRRELHPLPRGEDRRPSHGDLIEVQRLLPIDPHRARSPASRESGYRPLPAGEGEPRLDAHRAVDEGQPPGTLRGCGRMDAERPVIFDQLAGQGLGGIGGDLEAGAETGLERLHADGGADRLPHAAVWKGCQSSPAAAAWRSSSLRQPTTSPDLMRLMS